MIMDYHIHTRSSPDATGEMSEYIEQARKQNIDEIGFSEHIVLHYETDYPRLSLHTMNNYVEEFLRVKRNAEMPIKLGAEVDFFAADVDKISDFLKEYPFDYVIGSVHYLGNWSVDSSRQVQEYSRRSILQVYEDYFAMVRRLCQSKLFDVLGHADLIKIFGFKPESSFDSLLDETAKALARSDLCVEINTSGIVRPCKEMYPSLPFLALLRKHNVRITFGSDAHRPGDVGRRFHEAITLAKEAGYTHACTFEARRRTAERIGIRIERGFK